MRKLLFPIFFLTFAIYGSNAQNSSFTPGFPFIDYFSPDEYSGDPQNWAVTQNKIGIIYVGNNTDIYEYDGNNWSLISFNKRRIRDLSIDSAGTVFVGGSDDFGYLSSNQTGTTQFVSLLSKLKKDDKDFQVIWRVVAIKDGVYFLSKNKIFHYTNDTITTIQSKTDIVRSFGCAINNELFVINNEGIGWVKNDRIHILPYSKTIDVINSTVILPYKKDKILFKHRNSDFYIYHLDLLSLKDETSFIASLNKITPFVVEKFPTEVDGLFSNNTLWAATSINDSTFAFGYTLGIVIMDDRGKLVQKIDESNGLKNGMTNCLYLDINGDLWAGLGKGIARIEINNPITVFDASNGFDTHFLGLADYRNNLYFGGISKVYRLPRQDINNLTPSLIPIGDNYTYGLATFKDWLFAFTIDGLYHVNISSTERISSYLAYCWDTLPKFPDYFFLGLQSGVVALKFNKPSANLTKPEVQESVVFEGLGSPIRKLSVDNKNNLWVSSEYNGIFYLKFNSTSINDYEIIKYDTLNGLPSMYANYVNIIDSTVYVFTINGVYQFHNGKFLPDTIIGKLFNTSTKLLQKQSNDKYWAIANYQVSLIKREKNKYSQDVIPFKKMQMVEKLFLDNNGIIWTAGYKGLFRFDPKKQKDYRIPFNCLIRNVAINHDSTIFQGTYFDPESEKGGLFLKKSQVQPESLTPILDYKYNSITFTYSATYYDKKFSNQYSYKLEGFDKNWSGWSFKTLKEYTNLSKGEYIFRVKAKNVYDTESTESLYTFTILPPWYQTIWAYILYTLTLTFFTYLGIVLFTKRLKAQNVKLEKIVKERTEEIRLQKEEIEAQAKELAKLSIVASETNNAITIMDAEGNFEWFNNAYKNLFGYNFDEFIQERGKNILTTSFNNDIKELLLQCLEKKKPVTYQNKNISKYGEEIWTQTTITPILSDDGNIKKLISIEANIDKIKEYENELLQKNEEIVAQRDALAEANTTKDKFFSIISHDLKSPFNSILGLSEILAENFQCITKEKGELFSKQLHHSAKQVYNLVENLLEWSKTKTNRIKSLPEKINLKNVVDEVISVVILVAKEKNIEIERGIQENTFVYADPYLVSIIIRNLLSNAIKFSKPSGKVAINQQQLDKFIEISVSDSGVGMNRESLSKLFREDVHFSTAGTNKEKGTGLGLIICKEFVEKSGGRIWVESKLGEGTTFTFTLPEYNNQLVS